MTKYHYDLYDFGCIPASATYPNPPTDNTAAIQTALNTVPGGGTLQIPPDYVYSPTGQFVGGFGFSSTLTMDNPVNIVGGGMYSNLKPLPGFSATQPNLWVRRAGTYWFDITFSGFSIGDDPAPEPFTRSGGTGIWVNAAPGGMSRVFLEKLMIGESGNAHSVVIDGIGTQRCRIKSSTISGGLWLNSVADSHVIDDCELHGRSVFGVKANLPGAGGLKLLNSTITAVGGVIIQSGSLTEIDKCFFEERPGYPTNNVSFGGTNAQLALVGYPDTAVESTRIRNNIFNMGTSPDGVNILLNPATRGVNRTLIEGNIFNVSTNRGNVANFEQNLVCGPNYWLQPVRFKPGSAAPVSTYGGG